MATTHVGPTPKARSASVVRPAALATATTRYSDGTTSSQRKNQACTGRNGRLIQPGHLPLWFAALTGRSGPGHAPAATVG